MSEPRLIAVAAKLRPEVVAQLDVLVAHHREHAPLGFKVTRSNVAAALIAEALLAGLLAAGHEQPAGSSETMSDAARGCCGGLLRGEASEQDSCPHVGAGWHVCRNEHGQFVAMAAEDPKERVH